MSLALPASATSKDAADQQQTPTDWFVIPTVFLTGAAVLVLEILGTRLLSPHFGNNIYVWSALISVTMIALALGYWLGGKLADARGGPALLDQVVGLAGLFTAFVPLLVRLIAPSLFYDFDYRAGILITSMASFGPALFLLGMVSPVAVKLEVEDITHVGRSAGRVYAWSTAGGIAGALTAGFFLFPSLSVTSTCHIAAATLVTLSAARWITRRFGRRWGSRAAGVALCVVLGLGLTLPFLFVAAPSGWSDGEFEVLFDQPSFYGGVKVVDYDGYRMLMIDGMCHNATSLETGRSVMPHVPVFELLPYLRPGSESALLIGLGGGDMVRSLDRYGIAVTAVEIDPAVGYAAREYFQLAEVDCDIAVSDGRVFLRQTNSRFDFVIVDAFMGGTVPAHLFTVEAFELMKQRLAPGGVLALNVVLILEERLVDDLALTLDRVFANHKIVAIEDPNSGVTNAVFFASDSALSIPAEFDPAPSDDLASLGPRLPELLFEARPGRGVMITDEHNSVEAQSASADFALRTDSRFSLPESLLTP